MSVWVSFRFVSTWVNEYGVFRAGVGGDYRDTAGAAWVWGGDGGGRGGRGLRGGFASRGGALCAGYSVDEVSRVGEGLRCGNDGDGDGDGDASASEPGPTTPTTTTTTHTTYITTTETRAATTRQNEQEQEQNATVGKQPRARRYAAVESALLWCQCHRAGGLGTSQRAHPPPPAPDRARRANGKD